ncbi:hypothetical protein [Deinococcus sp. KSM4-11]|uniref:hypothetical protein n=1 Tax=Deinococcus sp. KSM4-11 TaxID=2568654 RepID=UPI001454D372|nr:hypothetical protein [Deinococcus sp. KSM4-11]
MTLWTPPLRSLLPTAFGPAPELLRRLTRDLSAQQAQHVGILTPAGVTATSEALRAALRVHHFHPVTGQPLDATGRGGLGGLVGGLLRGVAGPAAGSDVGGSGVDVPCRDENSGPYRRVYSKPGFAFQSSRVYLPSDQQGDLHEEKGAGHGDTAFVYVGGWGASGGAVDAGLQHGRYMNGSQDDWAPFFLVQQPGGPSAVTVSDERQAGGDPWRLRAGQDAELTFWVTQDADLTVLSLSVTGETNRDRTRSTLTLRAPIDARFGWDAGGGANILKRMTTLGQTAGQQHLQTGSFLQGVNWQGSTLGRSADTAVPWQAAQTGGYCTFPDPATPVGQQADGHPKWHVEYRDAGNETASVYLR